jgi:DNA-binding NtrC family response regulator
MDEREILYKVLFDMKGDLNDLKQLVLSLMKHGGLRGGDDEAELVQRVFKEDAAEFGARRPALPAYQGPISSGHGDEDTHDIEHQPADEEVLSLQDSERELIRRALEKHRNKRKYAAEELGISERTLYRKIKEYDLK